MEGDRVLAEQDDGWNVVSQDAGEPEGFLVLGWFRDDPSSYVPNTRSLTDPSEIALIPTTLALIRPSARAAARDCGGALQTSLVRQTLTSNHCQGSLDMLSG